MTKAELVLEKRHAKYMVDFYKIHKNGSYRANQTYQTWLNKYKELKRQFYE